MDQRRKQEEEEKRYRYSRHTSVDGKEEHKRPMAKSNHSISLGCDVETLEEYTTELERKSGENKNIIQNRIDQVMDAKKLVIRDLQSYARYFTSYNHLRRDPIYNHAKLIVNSADEQVKDSLRIIHEQNEAEKMEQQIQAGVPKRQFMTWSGRCSDYSIYKSQCQ